MSETCPGCGGRSRTAHPARFSPDDRYGKYRRIGIEEEYGENGKYRGGAQ
ncbi:MAG: ribosome biogenesis protein [Thermoplasmatales archaeon]|nr:ribosome biogenesis protein [Thermoplasmatales archaeon]